MAIWEATAYYTGDEVKTIYDRRMIESLIDILRKDLPAVLERQSFSSL